MRPRQFTIWLCGTILTSTAILHLCSYHHTIGQYIDIGWYAVGVFSVLSIVVYLLTSRLRDTTRKVLFIQVILSNMILKMMASGVIAFIYYQTKQPADGLFIVPFLAIYVIFTIFESYFMNKQAQAS